MRFHNSYRALEWLVGHRLSTIPQRSYRDRLANAYDGAMVTAADIESILGQFPVGLQKAMTAYVMGEKCSPFVTKAFHQFGHKLAQAGYIRNTGDPHSAYQIAA